jgi:hypothetical protein
MGNIESAVSHAAISVVGAVTGAEKVSNNDRSPGIDARINELVKIRMKGSSLTKEDETRISEIESELDEYKKLIKKKNNGSITEAEKGELDALMNDKYNEWKETHQDILKAREEEFKKWISEHTRKEVFNLHVRPADDHRPFAAALRPIDNKKILGGNLAYDLGM